MFRTAIRSPFPRARPDEFRGPLAACLCIAGLAAWTAFSPVCPAAEKTAIEAFDEVEPILIEYCYECHGDGMDRGDFALDEFDDLSDHLGNFDVWYETWKNLRSQLMPPSDEIQPGDAERERLMAFIERHVFRIDHENPDPGRVTIRRLNREEYRWTIHDLLNVDFPVEDVLPPDDTGYGFDTIGDVLSISPLLMEKYLEAARIVVEKGVPTSGPVIQEWGIDTKTFQDERNEKWSVKWMPFDHARRHEAKPWIQYDGEYEIRVDFAVRGSDEATSHSALLRLGMDDKELNSRKLGWDQSRRLRLQARAHLEKGHEQVFWLETDPKDPPLEGEDKLAVAVESFSVRGPLDGSRKDYPWSARHLFSEGAPPGDEDARDPYRRKILERFATRAFRRPVDQETVERLVALARQVDKQPGKRFEHGIAHAITAILVSPRFLLRAEIQPEPDNPDRVVPIDEYSLASRLSYFLWSSCPDDELLRLAGEGRLRENLAEQVDRMIGNGKSERFVENFVGQWLMARDVETVHIDAGDVLRRDGKGGARRQWNWRLRRAMRKESEKLFGYVLRGDRPAAELLTADYTFLNESLAEWYGIDGIDGDQMRKVDLPADSNRGGLLSQATFHVVTSNPTRTSPVKRGLFVLENFLATPAPPAVPEVPSLEERATGKNRNLPLRDLLALHAEEKLCASCHARMDPIGLALENFNPVGMWRDTYRGQEIDTSGELITGESFETPKELSRILATDRSRDFHRALVEKLLTYAVGRGIEYFDAPTIDRILDEVEAEGGTLRSIIHGVVASAPFQKRRGEGDLFAGGSTKERREEESDE